MPILRGDIGSSIGNPGPRLSFAWRCPLYPIVDILCGGSVNVSPPTRHPGDQLPVPRAEVWARMIAGANCRATLSTVFLSRLRGYKSRRMHETIVVIGLIVFNFVLLALAAAAGLFDVDVVFALMLLLLTATATLVSVDRQ